MRTSTFLMGAAAILTGRDNSRIRMSPSTRSGQLCPAPPGNLPTVKESAPPVSDGVWMIFAILCLTTITAGYLFWAKITGAWPFGF